MRLVRLDSEYTKGNMLQVTPDEALSLIKSLSTQLYARDPNTNRAEYYIGEEYFSVSVDFTNEKGRKCE